MPIYSVKVFEASHVTGVQPGLHGERMVSLSSPFAGAVTDSPIETIACETEQDANVEFELKCSTEYEFPITVVLCNDGEITRGWNINFGDMK